MKTVMKKLLSLMLVAVLLVSAVPFQASADSGYECEITVWYDSDGNGTYGSSPCMPAARLCCCAA